MALGQLSQSVSIVSEKTLPENKNCFFVIYTGNSLNSVHLLQMSSNANSVRKCCGLVLNSESSSKHLQNNRIHGEEFHDSPTHRKSGEKLRLQVKESCT